MEESFIPQPGNTELTSQGKLLPHIEPTSISYAYVHAATSHNTRKSYRYDIRQFMTWGGVLPTTTDVIIRYLEQNAGQFHPNTLKRRLTAIRNWHTYQGFPDPTKHPLVQKTLSGIARTHLRPTKKAPALSLEQAQLLSKRLLSRGRLVDWRNHALLQIGFFGAFRRSELVGIEWKGIEFVPEGVEIYIPKSKTDQEGQGQICAIPYGKNETCPVMALKMWQEKCQRKAGPVFVGISKSGRLSTQALSPHSLSALIKHLAVVHQLPHAEKFSAHSLRRGFATSASKKGACITAIMRHGRWKSEKTVFEYIDEAQRFQDNAAGVLLRNESTQALK